MNGKSRITGLAITAAMTGLVGGTALSSIGCKTGGTDAGKTTTMNKCAAGQNECKGKGACKTSANACNGQNDCKGKGGGAAAK